MDTKIVLLLMAVAVSAGYCEPELDFYGHEHEPLYAKVKLDRHLTDEYAPDTKEVARLLAKADNSFQALEATKGVQIFDLLDLTSPDPSCRYEKFAKFEEWRKLYSAPDGNVYLRNFVNENIDRLHKHCTQDFDKLFKLEATIHSPEGTYSQKISKYAATAGEESDPQEKTVRDFLAAKVLEEHQEKQFIRRCAFLEPYVKDSLTYFMKDENKASDYLDNLSDTPEALLYERCKIVNKMFGKQ